MFFSALAGDGLSASGLGLSLGDPFSSSATASGDVSTIEGEGAALTSQLTGVEADINDTSAITAQVDSRELSFVTDTLAFQQQINGDVDSLPTVTAQDETNPLLIADLGALYSHEIDFGTLLTNLGNHLANGSPTGITEDNAAILANGLGLLIDTQSTADTLTALADLSSLGL